MKILVPVRSAASQPVRQQLYLLAAIALVLIIALHNLHFAKLDYREDEIHTLHMARELSIPRLVQYLGANDIHPPVWRIFAVGWINTFGLDAGVVRSLSALFTLLTLACTFRLASDLFSHTVGLIAVIVLGCLPFFQFYGHELRPYAVLAMTAVGMQWSLLRWIQRRKFVYALLFFVLGTLALYTHFFAIFALAALFITALIVARPERGFILWLVGLFAAIALSFIPWIIPLLHGMFVRDPGGAHYTLEQNAEGFITLLRAMQGLPLLVLPALLIPVSMAYPYTRHVPAPAMRFQPEWRRIYVIVFPVLALLLILLTDRFVSILTPRNLMIVVPSLAILTAALLAVITPVLRNLMVALIVLSGIFGFQSFNLTVPYQGIVDILKPAFQPGDRIVSNINHNEVGVSALVYYLLDFMPGQVHVNEMVHIVEPDVVALFQRQLTPVANLVRDDSPAAVADFERFLDDTQRVWFIQYDGPPFLKLPQAFQQALDVRFTACQTHTLPMAIPPDSNYVVIEYRTDCN